jgi:hypothetical protein
MTKIGKFPGDHDGPLSADDLLHCRHWGPGRHYGPTKTSSSGIDAKANTITPPTPSNGLSNGFARIQIMKSKRHIKKQTHW